MTSEVPRAQPPKVAAVTVYRVSTILLLLLNGIVSWGDGTRKGMHGAELLGYASSSAVLAGIVIGVIRVARASVSPAKVATYTLLIILLINGASFASKDSAPTRAIEKAPPAATISNAEALSLRDQVLNAVRTRRSAEVAALRDYARFEQRVLAGFGNPSGDERQVAVGAAKSFKEGSLLQQIEKQLASDGDFNFVKFYTKESDPILQFRMTGDVAGLHYLDLYLCRSADGVVRIDDMQYYNSGERISREVVAFAREAVHSGDIAKNMQTAQDAMEIARQGDSARALKKLESLPEEFKRTRPIMRLRIQLGSRIGTSEAAKLLLDFRQRFPNDPSATFSAFHAAIQADNAVGAARLLDQISSAVGGDEYLLWYKANLLVVGGQTAEAVKVLKVLAELYKIDVAQHGPTHLVPELLTSSEYRAAFGKNRP